jgi:hypothetical protein
MIHRVKEPFAFTDSKGVPRVMSAGDLVSEGHEAYRKNWLHLMEPVEEAAARSVPVTETATADPGTKRSVAPTELDLLRQAAADLGVKVDGRWSVERLQQEIDKATSKADS